MEWIYKGHLILVNNEGLFKFKHKNEYYWAETLKQAKLMIDAMCKNITVNKYEIVAELAKIYTNFKYIKHILGDRFGFENIKLPRIEEFEKNINDLMEKYENK